MEFSVPTYGPQIFLHVLDVSAHSDNFLYILMLRCIFRPWRREVKTSRTDGAAVRDFCFKGAVKKKKSSEDKPYR